MVASWSSAAWKTLCGIVEGSCASRKQTPTHTRHQPGTGCTRKTSKQPQRSSVLHTPQTRPGCGHARMLRCHVEHRSPTLSAVCLPHAVQRPQSAPDPWQRTTTTSANSRLVQGSQHRARQHSPTQHTPVRCRVTSDGQSGTLIAGLWPRSFYDISGFRECAFVSAAQHNSCPGWSHERNGSGFDLCLARTLPGGLHTTAAGTTHLPLYLESAVRAGVGRKVARLHTL